VAERQGITTPDLQTNHATIPLAIGLSVAAFRVSVLPRVWFLLLAALAADGVGCAAIGLERQRIARDWGEVITTQLPVRFFDVVDKVWFGPLGLAAPFLDFLVAESGADFLRCLLGMALTLGVWGLFGGAICRIASTRMTLEPMPGAFAALAYVLRRWRIVWGTPAIMLSSVIALCLILALFGAITLLPVAGPLLAWIFVPAAILALSLCGVFFGWQMMLSASLDEDSDCFDALSRSQCYLFQAPVTWLLTLKVGLIVQTIGFIVVRWFLRGVVDLIARANHASGVGQSYASISAKSLPDPWMGVALSADALEFWSAVMRLAAVSWPIGFQFAFAAAIYLAMRSRVDGIPTHASSLHEANRSSTPKIEAEALDVLTSAGM
jgi:hypothetical protein